MSTVAGGVKPPSGSGLPHWDKLVKGAGALHGMPKPTARSDFPPRAATGALAPRVTSVPAGRGHGAVAHVAVVRGPSSETVDPPTITGLLSEPSRTGGSVLVSGIR